jgi:group I intron endonuclease
MVGIYKIKNRITHKVYAGESVDIKSRWYTHKSELRRGVHHSERLQKEWKKYGEKAFRFSVVERFWFTMYANPNKLKIALLMGEGYWIDRYNSIYDYNNEDSIGDLKKFADLGKGNPKFKRYNRYRRFIRRNMIFAKRWMPHILVATLYNPIVKLALLGLLVYGGYYLWTNFI